MKPQHPRATAAEVTVAAARPVGDLQSVIERRRKERRAGSLRVLKP